MTLYQQQTTNITDWIWTQERHEKRTRYLTPATTARFPTTNFQRKLSSDEYINTNNYTCSWTLSVGQRTIVIGMISLDDYMMETSNEILIGRHHRQKRNASNAYCYVNTLDSLKQSEWKGWYGTIALLMKNLRIRWDEGWPPIIEGR